MIDGLSDQLVLQEYIDIYKDNYGTISIFATKFVHDAPIDPGDNADLGAVLVIAAGEVREGLRIAIEAEDWAAHQLEQEIADGIAQYAAEHRAYGRDRGVGPGLDTLGQHHRDQHHVGGNRKHRTLQEGDARQRPGRIPVGGEFQDLVVERTQHGAT